MADLGESEPDRLQLCYCFMQTERRETGTLAPLNEPFYHQLVVRFQLGVDFIHADGKAEVLRYFYLGFKKLLKFHSKASGTTRFIE